MFIKFHQLFDFQIVSAKVIRNKQTAQSEGYGFIEFASHAAAERNLQAFNGTLMPNVEQNFRLNWASMGAGEKRSDDSPDYTIFVGDLAGDVTDYMLQETFRAVFSSVKGAKVVTDRLTGRSKGYGFVKFADENEQLRALTEMTGKYCSTRVMRIGPAANKKTMGGQSTGMHYLHNLFLVALFSLFWLYIYFDANLSEICSFSFAMELFFGSRIFCFQGIAGFYFLGLMYKSTDVTLLRLLLGSLTFSCALEYLKIITNLEVI